MHCMGQSAEKTQPQSIFNETLRRKLKQMHSVWKLGSTLQSHPLIQSHTHRNMWSNSNRLKVVALIEYINLTTDVIDQKANSSSVITLEGKTIAKWLCKVHSLGKQIWDPLKPWRLSSLSPTICRDCAKHLVADLPHLVESQWQMWQGAHRHPHAL